jgi:hypothetical protein
MEAVVSQSLWFMSDQMHGFLTMGRLSEQPIPLLRYQQQPSQGIGQVTDAGLFEGCKIGSLPPVRREGRTTVALGHLKKWHHLMGGTLVARMKIVTYQYLLRPVPLTIRAVYGAVA